jgi:hypothetical protein
MSNPQRTEPVAPVRRTARRMGLALMLLVGSTTTMVSASPIAVASIAGAYVPLDPARLMDTRTGTSTIGGLYVGGGARSAGSTTELQVTGRVRHSQQRCCPCS